MFTFPCIDLKFIVRASPIPGLHLLQNQSKSPSLRCTPTKIIESQNAITSSCLVDSYGLSPKSASELLRVGTPENLYSFLSFLKEHGFSEAQIRKILKSKTTRTLPLSNIEETVLRLLPIFEFFWSKGFSKSDIAKMFSKCPRLLHISLENNVIPCFKTVEGLNVTEQRIVSFFKLYPQVVFKDIRTELALKMNYFRAVGLSESGIVWLLRYWPGIIALNLNDAIKNAVEKAITMGVHPSKFRFRQAFITLTSVSESTWEYKVLLFERWGWSEEDVSTAFVKYPAFMAKSEKKIMAVMDFFVNQLGWRSSILAKHPNIFNYSLKKKLIPRGFVWKFLATQGLIKGEFRNLKFFTTSENIFLKKHVFCYNEAPRILEIYEEKLDCSK